MEDELKDAEREILDLSKNLERERAEKETLEKKKTEMENEIQNLRDTTLGKTPTDSHQSFLQDEHFEIYFCCCNIMLFQFWSFN